ncbi:MAG: thioesterase family protein, partial [Thermoanaerobaculia bacterium]|nr:thioesterase family protein [Thermoanaerobaculia bacterium]
EMPAAPPPEGLLDRDRERERIVGHRSAHPAIEVRMCEAPPFGGDAPSSPFQRNWIRVTGGLGDDPRIHEAVLVYASDAAFMSTVNRRHPIPWRERMAASLDHSLWIHRRPRMTGWHLFTSESPAAHAGRGLVTGAIWSADGTLVASVAQEAIVRRRRSQAPT